jgi:hypothetical protein
MMTLRCLLDGLLLPAVARSKPEAPLTAWDGDESFEVEPVEAMYYQLVTATRAELLHLEQAHYRLLRPAPDFQLLHR